MSNSNKNNLQLTFWQLKAAELKRKAAEIDRKIKATIQASESSSDQSSESQLDHKEVDQDSEFVAANQTAQASEITPNSVITE